MALAVHCPHCHKKGSVPDAANGRSSAQAPAAHSRRGAFGKQLLPRPCLAPSPRCWTRTMRRDRSPRWQFTFHDRP